MYNKEFKKWLENLELMICFNNKIEQTRVLSKRICWQARDNCTIYSESDVEAEVLTEIAQAFFNNLGKFEA